MTTTEAALQYLAEHERQWHGTPYAVYNPHNKPIDSLPIIYGYNSGGYPSWYYAVLLAEDGTYLGGHICSEEGHMYHDLGILEGTREDRHETFRQHYPDGYRMDFVSYYDVLTHEGLIEAYKRNQALAEAAKEEQS